MIYHAGECIMNYSEELFDEIIGIIDEYDVYDMEAFDVLVDIASVLLASHLRGEKNCHETAAQIANSVRDQMMNCVNEENTKNVYLYH